jgi:hypothetical protein
MTEQIITLINQINSIEQQLRDLNDEKRVLEKDLDRFSISDHAVRIAQQFHPKVTLKVDQTPSPATAFGGREHTVT